MGAAAVWSDLGAKVYKVYLRTATVMGDGWGSPISYKRFKRLSRLASRCKSVGVQQLAMPCLIYRQVQVASVGRSSFDCYVLAHRISKEFGCMVPSHRASTTALRTATLSGGLGHRTVEALVIWDGG